MYNPVYCIYYSVRMALCPGRVMIRQCSAELVLSSCAECGGSRVLDTMVIYKSQAGRCEVSQNAIKVYLLASCGRF